MSEKEIRFAELEDMEYRDDDLSISGYAITYGKTSVTLGGSNGFKEIISERALDGVDLSNVHLYYQHNDDNMLANTKSGTMSLENTNKGLYFRANMADTTLGKDVYKLIKRGDLSAMSFGFQIASDSWDMSQVPEVRTVNKIDKLLELSVVSNPAYETSSVSTRSLSFLNECKECRQDMTDMKVEHNPELLEEAKQILDSVKTNQTV